MNVKGLREYSVEIVQRNLTGQVEITEQRQGVSEVGAKVYNHNTPTLLAYRSILMQTDGETQSVYPGGLIRVFPFYDIVD